MPYFEPHQLASLLRSLAAMGAWPSEVMSAWPSEVRVSLQHASLWGACSGPRQPECLAPKRLRHAQHWCAQDAHAAGAACVLPAL